MARGDVARAAARYCKQHSCSFIEAGKLFNKDPESVRIQFLILFPNERPPKIVKRNTLHSRIEELWEDGASVDEICRKLRVKKPFVYTWSSKTGMNFREVLKKTTIYTKAAEEVRNGKIIKQAAADNELTAQALARYCRIHGIKWNEIPLANAGKEVSKGASIGKAAAKYQVNAVTLSRYCRRNGIKSKYSKLEPTASNEQYDCQRSDLLSAPSAPTLSLP